MTAERIVVDRERCVGAGQCVLSAPGVFTQGDEDGRVQLVDPGDPDAVSAAREAVTLCPAGALRITESEDGSDAPSTGPALLARLLREPDATVSDVVKLRRVADLAGPHLLFVLVYAVTRELAPAVWTALLAAGALAADRLARRTPARHALAGLAGVGISALVAAFTGRGEDFYLPDLVRGVGAAAVLLISVAVRWPLVGVVVGPALGQRFRWRRERRLMRAYRQCTVVWAGVGIVRMAVQIPLYLSGDVVALGIAHALMGLPLLALTLWICLSILRRARAADP